MYGITYTVREVRDVYTITKSIRKIEPRHKKTCFLHMQKQRRRSAPLFSLCRYYNPSTSYIQSFKPLTIFCCCTYSPVCVRSGQKPKDRFSHDTAQIAVIVIKYLSHSMKKHVVCIFDNQQGISAVLPCRPISTFVFRY